MKQKNLLAKMMFSAFVMTSALSANAQGDIKSILKTDDYQQAESMVKTALPSLNNEDKAKAYNKLVDLLMKKVEKESTIMTNNSMVEKLKSGKMEPCDSAGLYQAVYLSLENAMECDKYDQMPNEKGKVKSKFRKNNQERLYNNRVHLVNAGQSAAQAGVAKDVIKYWGMYIDSRENDLFKELAAKTPDQYLGQVALLTAKYCIQEKQMDKAMKYVEVAMTDKEQYTEALNTKLYIAQQGLKTKEDSVKFVQTLKAEYEKDKKNDQIFGTLCSIYGSLKQDAEFNALLNEKLKDDPNNAIAWGIKGQNEMNATKWDDAIASFKKSIELNPDNVLVLTYIGFCMNSKAAAIENNVPKQKELYKESMQFLLKAKEKDPNRQQANWAYPLYQCYYVLNGAEDAQTKEMEGLIKK